MVARGTAGCVVAPAVAVWAEPGGHLPWVSTNRYLMYSVLFRAAIQFSMVWLVAAVHQLSASRTALAAAAVQEERARLQREVRVSLERHLVALVEASRRARRALGTAGVAEPLVAVDGVLVQANAALRDLRAIVSETRAARPQIGAALARTVRAGRSPIGRGLATRQAWRTLFGVHAVVLLFPLLMCLNAFGIHDVRDPGLTVVGWFAVTVLTLLTSSRGAGRCAFVLGGACRRYRRAGVRVDLGGGDRLGDLGVVRGDRRGLVSARAPPRRRARPRAARDARLRHGHLDRLGGPGRVRAGLERRVLADHLQPRVAGTCSSARLVPIVAELESARDALAAGAVRAERRRLSRDLHDVLSQSLTAISLKADLARRLIATQRDVAAREIAEVETLATSLATEIEAVARDEREVAFADERPRRSICCASLVSR